MRVIPHRKNEHLPALIEAVHTLTTGGVVVVPTDTVYGLIGNATEASVIRKIFALKKRRKDRAFPIFVRDVVSARRLAYIDDAKAKILEKLWPGPVTVIFHHKEKLPKILTGSLDTIGMRMPAHQLISDILARVDFPLAQTSANISSKPPAINLPEILNYFKGGDAKPDLIVDGGTLKGTPSTLIDFTRSEPRILRTGLITRQRLDELMAMFQEHSA